jgi:hypothetical protein
MRHTRIAISLLVGLLGLYQLNGISSAVELQKALDLTLVPGSERRSMGVPGTYAGGISGGIPLGTLAGRYTIPIVPKIVTLQPHDNSGRALLTLEIVNTSKSDLAIPSCVDPYAPFVPGARNRHQFLFGLIWESTRTRQRSSELVEVTSGSSSVAKCMISLAPSETLAVMMNVPIPAKVAKPGGGRVVLRAYVEEWKLEDTRYYIERKSKRVESEPIEITF